MIVFVTFAIVGWEESNYLCNRKKQSQTEPQKPRPQPLSEGRGEYNEE